MSTGRLSSLILLSAKLETGHMDKNSSKFLGTYEMISRELLGATILLLKRQNNH